MKDLVKHIRTARAAFTLMEVNLAIFIMAVGVLAMTSLYPLGFRESEQSRDDVDAAIAADEVLGKLTAALSARDIEWDDWVGKVGQAVDKTPEGWISYCQSYGGASGKSEYKVKGKGTVHSTAQGVFGVLAGISSSKPTVNFNKYDKYAYGLVAQWGKRVVTTTTQESREMNDFSRVSISFRMARRPGALLTAPIYYTEVHFQGDQKEMN